MGQLIAQIRRVKPLAHKNRVEYRIFSLASSYRAASTIFRNPLSFWKGRALHEKARWCVEDFLWQSSRLVTSVESLWWLLRVWGATSRTKPSGAFRAWWWWLRCYDVIYVSCRILLLGSRNAFKWHGLILSQEIGVTLEIVLESSSETQSTPYTSLPHRFRLKIFSTWLTCSWPAKGASARALKTRK